MKKIFFYTLIVLVTITSCKKERAEMSQVMTATDASSFQAPAHATVTYPFTMQAGGYFTISPVSATIVKITQQLSFTSSSPFTLLQGVVTGYDDLTIPSFPERFFNGSFKFYGQGNDSLFATVTVQTSVFTDPIDPQSGDFFGSEDFTGTISFTGGTGRYLRASGSGGYSAHSEWRPPIIPGTIFSGFTTVNGAGTIAVLARNGHLTY